MPGAKAFFKKPKRKRKSKRLRGATSKRRKQLDEYSERRRLFLLKSENLRCPVMEEIKGRAAFTTDVHHMDGREGERLLDESQWLAVSREGHDWIHAHPKQARERGWLC